MESRINNRERKKQEKKQLKKIRKGSFWFRFLDKLVDVFYILFPPIVLIAFIYWMFQ